VSVSSVVLRWRGTRYTEPNFRLALVNISLSNWYSATRVQSTVEHHIEDMRGHSKANQQHVMHSSAAAEGEDFLFPLFDVDTKHIRTFRFSILPALSLNDGILHVDIVEGSFNSHLFYQFISRLLDRMQPFPAPNSVIVMDNCRIHKHPAVVQLIHER